MRTRIPLLDHLIGSIENKLPSDRLALRILFFAVIGTGLYFLISINNSFVLSTPTRGGTLKEGIIGIPRFVNPALAIARADQDVSALIYSGLMRISEDGALIPDIAESIELMDDSVTYNIKLRTDRFFHDGKSITAKDAIFTINLMSNPDLKSPLRGNWNDVTLEEVSEYEFKVILKEAYTPFIENFSFGIMPQHIWSNLPIEQLPFSQYNTEPIGSGPFMVAKVNRDTAGLISGYVLKPSPYSETEPNLANIELKFYQNENQLATALTNKEINATIYLPSELIKTLDTNNYKTFSQPLPRVFAIFFNQNRSVPLRDKAAREALSIAINRDRLITDVLFGYGVPIIKPIVEEHPTLQSEDTKDEEGASSTKSSAETILINGGWKKSDEGAWTKKIGQNIETLAVTIRTGNSPQFNATAEAIANNWRELGVDVQIEQYEQTGLVQSVIRSRDFQALLFGIDMNRLQDLYPFWHSSQKDDPGLNIAQYTNINVDKLLEKARTTTDFDEQFLTLTEVSNVIAAEVPAVFLYAPSVTYVIDKEIQTATLNKLGRPADRFMNIENWHARTDIVWPIFK